MGWPKEQRWIFPLFWKLQVQGLDEHGWVHQGHSSGLQIAAFSLLTWHRQRVWSVCDYQLWSDTHTHSTWPPMKVHSGRSAFLLRPGVSSSNSSIIRLSGTWLLFSSWSFQKLFKGANIAAVQATPLRASQAPQGRPVPVLIASLLIQLLLIVCESSKSSSKWFGPCCSYGHSRGNSWILISACPRLGHSCH